MFDTTTFSIQTLQLGEARKTDPTTELAEQKSGYGAEEKTAESTEDVIVLRLLRLRLHDVDGLSWNVVVCVFGHDCSLLGLIVF